MWGCSVSSPGAPNSDYQIVQRPQGEYRQSNGQLDQIFVTISARADARRETKRKEEEEAETRKIRRKGEKFNKNMEEPLSAMIGDLLSLALLVSSFLLFFSISFSRVVCKIMEVTKYDRVLAQCDHPAKRRRVIYDSDEEGFEPVVRENYRVTRPNLVGVLTTWNHSEPEESTSATVICVPTVNYIHFEI